MANNRRAGDMNWQKDIGARRKAERSYSANLPVSVELKYMNCQGSICYEPYTFTRYQPYGEEIMINLMARIEDKTGLPLLQDHHDFDDLEY